MALQIIPQQNQPNGLELLGQTLMGGARDYASQKRRMDEENRMRSLQLQDHATRRQQQLADVESNRGYESTQFDKIRSLQLGDEQRQRGERLTDATTKAAMENRLRNLQEAETRGLFIAKDLGNLEIENAALSALQQQVAKETTFAQEQPGNAQAKLAELGQAENAVTQKLAAVEARLSAQPSTDERAVMASAVQMATQANGGKMPSREQIQAAVPEAVAKSQSESQMRWYQDKQDASVQYQILSSQLNTIRQQQANLTSTFKVAPTASSLVAAPATAVGAGAPPARPVSDPLAGFTAALDARMGGRGATPPATPPATSPLVPAPGAPPAASRTPESYAMSGPLSLYDPVMDPALTTIADFMRNPRGSGTVDVTVPAPTDAAKLAATQQNLQHILTMPPTPSAGNPQAQSEEITRLLQQQAMRQRQIQQVAPSQFAPVTAGSLLSNPYAFGY